MKIICTDNYARDSVSERLVATGIVGEDEAECMCHALNEKFSGEMASSWYVVKPDDYVLWRGMPDIIGD